MLINTKLSHISAGFTAILIGYTSSVVIVMAAAKAAGASAAQTSSWLLILGVALGISSLFFSWRYKLPVLTAWSTPGAAMLANAIPGYSLNEVIGAFLVSGLLIFLTGLIRPLNRMIARIPTAISTAMLAAILLPFCVHAFTPLSTQPYWFLPLFIGFFAAKRFLPTYSMLILLLVAVAMALFSGAFSQAQFSLQITQPVWMPPELDLAAIINLGLPLYIITMLSQNLPGVAMLTSHGYRFTTQPFLLFSGALNALLAPFGCYSLNLAAISAAICMNKEVDADPAQRYKASMWAGLFYIIAGLWAGVVVTFFLALPKEITQILAGFALLGTLIMCLQTAFTREDNREAALLTFLISLSGISIMEISAPIIGLIVGIIYARLTGQKQQ